MIFIAERSKVGYKKKAGKGAVPAGLETERTELMEKPRSACLGTLYRRSKFRRQAQIFKNGFSSPA